MKLSRKEGPFLTLQYPDGKIVALDSASGGYPYKAGGVNSYWLLDKSHPASLKEMQRYISMFPDLNLKIVEVMLEIYEEKQ